MKSREIAERIENIFFPSNVAVISCIALISYLHLSGSPLSSNNIITFLLAVAVYIAALRITKLKVKSETKIYTVAGMASIGSFIIASFILPVSQEIRVGLYSLISMLIITHYIRDVWKISGHCMTYAGIVTVLSIADIRFAALFVVFPAVAWSRLKLKIHTPMQVVAGSALGIAIPIAVNMLL